MDFINLTIDKLDNYIEHLNSLLYKNNLESFNEWATMVRGLINLIINNYNYPYMTIRINDFTEVIKNNWTEFENDNPFSLISELVSLIKNNYKPKKYKHSILIDYQNIILETYGLKEYVYKVPLNESLFKLKNDILVLKVYLPSNDRDSHAYINWLIYRLSKFNIHVNIDKQSSLLLQWENINKIVFNTDFKKDSLKKSVPLLVLATVLVVSGYVFRR